MITQNDVKIIFADSDGYVSCENCPLSKQQSNYCAPFCDGRDKTYEAIANFLNSKSSGNDNDSVNHPSHYTRGKIEVIDFIADQKLNFNRGNAVKYICRAGFKGDEVEDLEKAIVYLQHEIKVLKDNG